MQHLRVTGRRCVQAIALLWALWLSAPCWADVYVVVSTSSPVVYITPRELTLLYLGRKRTLNDEVTQTLDHPSDSPVRKAFYKSLTGMDMAQINSYWSRLMFGGSTLPPAAMTGDSSMEAALRANPSAIGYLSREPTGGDLRVLLVLH